jgi:hypothetical protein
MAFGGVFSVLPTRFTPSGDIDPESLTRVIDAEVSSAVDLPIIVQDDPPICGYARVLAWTGLTLEVRT